MKGVPKEHQTSVAQTPAAPKRTARVKQGKTRKQSQTCRQDSDSLRLLSSNRAERSARNAGLASPWLTPQHSAGSGVLEHGWALGGFQQECPALRLTEGALRSSSNTESFPDEAMQEPNQSLSKRSSSGSTFSLSSLEARPTMDAFPLGTSRGVGFFTHQGLRILTNSRLHAFSARYSVVIDRQTPMQRARSSDFTCMSCCFFEGLCALGMMDQHREGPGARRPAQQTPPSRGVESHCSSKGVDSDYEGLKGSGIPRASRVICFLFLEGSRIASQQTSAR